MESTSGADVLKRRLRRIRLLQEEKDIIALFSSSGLATSYCKLELVFVVFSAQWKGSSNELPPAIYQRVVFRAHQSIPAFERR